MIVVDEVTNLNDELLRIKGKDLANPDDILIVQGSVAEVEGLTDAQKNNYFVGLLANVQETLAHAADPADTIYETKDEVAAEEAENTKKQGD